MKETINEGFWDSLLTTVKQGALAAMGTVSASHRGKLSASLLSSELFNQYKEWINKTGGEQNADTMRRFLKGMNFSDSFANDEATNFDGFLRGQNVDTHAERNGGQATQNAPEAPDQEEPEQEPEQNADEKPAEPEAKTPEQIRKEKQAAANQRVQDEMDKNDKAKQAEQTQKQNSQQQMHTRMQQKKAEGPRAKKTRESVELDEAMAVMSDFQLRKFFDVMAKRAFSSGEAKSAAKKSINAARIEPDQQQQAPQQQAQQAEPEQTQQAPAQQAAPAAQEPKAQAGLNLNLSPKEQDTLDRYGLQMLNMVGTPDDQVTHLAKKIIRQALAATNQQLKPSKPANDEQPPQQKPTGTDQ